MIRRVIRRYDIFAHVQIPKKMICLPTDATNILGRGRVEDSSLGDLPISPKTLLVPHDLFLGDEVCILPILH